VGALAGTIAAVGFGAAFLAAALVPVVAEVFFFLAIMAFVLAVILLVSYASCKCEQAR
jgi:membrane protein YqaA with SNARE-associated domain